MTQINPAKEEPMETTSFLSTADAARVLGVTPATVRLMVRRRDLPVAAMTESGIHLFSREAVDDLARQRADRKRIAERDSRAGTR